MTARPIGLIGVGLLGTALAERMLAAGYRVIGHDPRQEQLTNLRRLGGEAAPSARETAAKAETIVLCLPTSTTVAEVIAEIGTALHAGMIILDATTGAPEDATASEATLQSQGVGYLDATIAGSSEQARRGEATILLGGDPKHLEQARPILRSWSERLFHVGPPGSGARMKLIVNLVLGLNRAVLAEGLNLARQCGIDPARALEILKATPAYSRVMDTKGPKLVAGDFSPEARLSQHLKDVRLIEQLAAKHSARIPLTMLHAELLEQAVELGWGDADNSAIIRAFSTKSEIRNSKHETKSKQ